MQPHYSTFIKKLHPIWFVALGLSLGIALPPLYCLSIVTISSAFCVFFYRSLFLDKKFLAIYAFMFSAACITGSLRLYLLTKNHALIQNMLPKNSTSLEVHVTNITRTSSSNSSTAITGTITKIIDSNFRYQQKIVGQNIQIFSNKKEEVIPGNNILLQEAIINTPQGTDYNAYLKKQGIVGTIFLNNKNSITILGLEKTWDYYVYATTSRLARALKSKTNKMTHTLFSSLFIGDKNSANPDSLRDLKPYFSIWGIDHYLARSGLHMALLASTWTVASGFLPLSIALQSILLLLLGTIYLLLTQTSVSFLRAFCLFCIYKVYTACDYQINGFHALSLVTIGVLLHNPFQLFFLDFQLSFFLTFALIWISMLHAHKKRNS